MINVAGKSNYKLGSHAFGILAISFGVVLIFVSLIGGLSFAVVFARGILGHTISGVRSGVLELFYDLIVPLIGGIVLAFAGLRIISLDKSISTKEVATNSRRMVVQEKEHIMSVFLSSDEKKIIGLIKEDKEGSLQSDLVIKTGYSKVKMHRILKSLENKGLIKRGRFGITNKVFLAD